jgi:Fur family ferric uptake transcriptional regulator
MWLAPSPCGAESHRRSRKLGFVDAVKAETLAPRRSDDDVEEVLARVRSTGGRVTTPRRLLVRSLFEAAGHRTAEELAAEIQAQAPDVSISTVYRNLEELERLGVVVHAHLGHGPATYHLASAAHGHLACEKCDAHVEIPDGFFADLRRRAIADFGFVIDPRHFAVIGLCAACRADTKDFGDITGG